MRTSITGRISRIRAPSHPEAPAQAKITGGLADPASVLKPDPTP